MLVSLGGESKWDVNRGKKQKPTEEGDKQMIGKEGPSTG